MSPGTFDYEGVYYGRCDFAPSLRARNVSEGHWPAWGILVFCRSFSRYRRQTAQLPSKAVQFRPDIEPLVRLLETTSRDTLLEEIGGRIRRGLSYRDVLTALLLAGVRNVRPRPVGFKFHAVLVVNSAHLASIQSPDEHRWLPIFWALDYFKEAQSQNEREGDWTMSKLDEAKLPATSRAEAAFRTAMDAWDETAADTAAAALVRSSGLAGTYELLFRYGCRDFRDIGHKAIYVANSWRALGTVGPEHAEAVVRSLSYALLDRGGDDIHSDAPADRPIKRNRELAAKFPAAWQEGKLDDKATLELLKTLREGSDEDSCRLVVEMLNRGVAPQSLWDGLFVGAEELLMRQPGIIALHAVTSTNALHFAYKTDGQRRNEAAVIAAECSVCAALSTSDGATRATKRC